MYWYRSKLLFTGILTVGLCLLLALAACKGPDIKNGAALKYFDLKGYFHADSARLTGLNKPVFKTVMHNYSAESKKVHIANWGTELSLFEESDINRPAWKDSYTIQSDSGLLVYKAKNPGLKTKEIIIKQTKGKVKWILIFNHTKNPLFETHEKLSYFPDSLYLIEKSEKVIFLGINKYQVKGVF